MGNVNKLDLSIIILSYKSKEHLKVLLPSIWASEGMGFVGSRHGVTNGGGRAMARPYTKNTADVAQGLALPSQQAEGPHYTAEVIVVDNDSRDGTFEWLESYVCDLSDRTKGIHLIKNQNNGFAKGNNLGISQSSGKYILLLNPDTKLEPDTLRLMLDLMESRSDIGISGCKLIKGDGKLDLACRRRFPNPWNSFFRLFLKNNKNYNYSDVDEDQEMEVDSVVGAFLLIRREVMDKIGLLDETFFMYGEDLDWCWRCKEAGFKVWYYPKAICHHYKGESSKKAPFRMLKVFHDAMWIFYRKHYGARYPFFFNWLVWVGIYGRMMALVIINVFKKKRMVSK